jgi:hypothetical protein
MHRMRTLLTAAGVFAALALSGANAENPSLTPGLYQVEVRISMPNVQDVAVPFVVTRCINSDDLESGQAFFVLSDNPLKTCELVDYRATAGTATYRIACAGPNRGSAVALFDVNASGYRGTIKMNMGGKNMTMSETQVGKRIGNCR